MDQILIWIGSERRLERQKVAALISGFVDDEIMKIISSRITFLRFRCHIVTIENHLLVLSICEWVCYVIFINKTTTTIVNVAKLFHHFNVISIDFDVFTNCCASLICCESSVAQIWLFFLLHFHFFFHSNWCIWHKFTTVFSSRILCNVCLLLGEYNRQHCSKTRTIVPFF